MAVAGSAVGTFGGLGGAVSRRPLVWFEFARSLAFPGLAALRRLATLAVVAIAIALASAPRTEATPLERSVRNIAETVLGSGTVTFVQLASKDREAVLRWEAATYKPKTALAEARELLYGEAELTTGALRGRLPQLIRVRFIIVHGKDILARGESGRSGLRLVFAPSLGGGTYVLAAAQEEDKSGGSSRASQVR